MMHRLLESSFVRRYSILVTLLLAVALMAGAVPASPSRPPADIHESAYMGIIQGNSREEFEQDPVYVRFGQDGGRLYGTMISAKISAPFDFTVGLEEQPLVDGVIKGKKFTLFAVDLDSGDRLRFDGTVIKGGKQIKAKLFPVNGPPKSFRLYRIEETDSFSGQYTGTFDSGLSARAVVAPSNMVFGLSVQGTEMTWAVVFAASDFEAEPISFGGDGPFDPVTGQFSMPEDEGIALEGEIDENGHMTALFTLQDPDGEVNNGEPFESTATLDYFGDLARKSPKLKSPKPAKVAAGETRIIRIKHKFVLPGALVTEDTEGVVINSYQIAPQAVARGKGGTIEVEIEVSAEAAGSEILLTVTNPDGKSATAKKTIKVR